MPSVEHPQAPLPKTMAALLNPFIFSKNSTVRRKRLQHVGQHFVWAHTSSEQGTSQSTESKGFRTCQRSTWPTPLGSSHGPTVPFHAPFHAHTPPGERGDVSHGLAAAELAADLGKALVFFSHEVPKHGSVDIPAFYSPLHSSLFF